MQNVHNLQRKLSLLSVSTALVLESGFAVNCPELHSLWDGIPADFCFPSVIACTNMHTCAYQSGLAGLFALVTTSAHLVG